MQANINIRNHKGIWADFHIVNNLDSPVKIHNPGQLSPTEGWATSKESYQIAVLLSFHFLKMKLFTTKDELINRHPWIGTMADHSVEFPIVLKPSEELIISIPIHEFYTLKRGVTYKLDITYGDESLRVSANTKFVSP